MQVQEAQRVPNKLDPKRPTPRHTIIKLTKFEDKERILKTTREKQEVTYKGEAIRLSSDFSTGTFQTRREWQEIFKVMESRNLHLRPLYPARLSFKIKREIKSFPEKKKLRKFVNAKAELQQMVKGLL